MARILLFQHVPFEPLGTLSPLIRERGHRVRYVNFSRDSNANPSIEKYDGLIILGGPANVSEIAQYPYLRTEMNAIERAMAAGLPILGICLGCQLIAGSLGAKVYPAATKEVGWVTLTPTAAGKHDPLISPWRAKETLFQWHGHTYDLPPQAITLVTGTTCPEQAFRVGDNVYGFQFHLEVNEALIKRWLSLPIYQPDLQPNIDEKRQLIWRETQQRIAHNNQLARRVFGAFLDLLPTVERQQHLASR